MAHDIEDKIAKLLTKAEGQGVTPQEAESLSAAAERLMVKYSLERAVIDAKMIKNGGLRTEVIVKHNTVFNGEYRDVYANMANSIVRALGNGLTAFITGGSFTETRKCGRTFFVVGYEDDVNAAMTLIASLTIQAANAMNKFKPAGQYTPSQRLRQRKEFIRSFGVGANSRITQARAAAMDSVKSTHTGAELAVVDRGHQVDSWLQDQGIMLGRARRASRSGQGLGGASAAGYESGRKASTGERNISAGRTALSR